MKGSMSTDLGIITIDPEVIAKYAGSVAVECFGIVGMAAVSMKDGLVKLLKKESLTKGIQVGISDENKITLNFHVVVAYGVSISAVTDNLLSNNIKSIPKLALSTFSHVIYELIILGVVAKVPF